jgi:hypothetical protein
MHTLRASPLGNLLFLISLSRKALFGIIMQLIVKYTRVNVILLSGLTWLVWLSLLNAN